MLGRKTLLSVISLLIIRITQGLILILAVNTFLPTLFGYVTVAQSLLSFFLFFSDLNLSTAHLKLMAEKDEKNIAFSTYFYLKIILVVISSVVFLFIIIALANSNFITNTPEQISIISLIFIDRIIYSFLMVFLYSFQATLKIAKKVLVTIIGQFFGLFVALISILLFKNFLLYLMNTIVADGVSLLLGVYFGREFKLSKIKRDLLLRYLKLDLVFILPFFINVISTNLGPLLLLQGYNEELLGVYNIITTFFLMIAGLQEILKSLLIPNFSVLLKKNNLKEIGNSISLFEKYTTILNGSIIVMGIIFSDLILRTLFGQLYFDKGLFLYFGFLLNLLTISIFGPYSPLIIASEKFKIYTSILIIGLISSILSWIFFIPTLNILGIKLGTWLSVIPNTIYIRFCCYKYFKIGKMNSKQVLNLIFVGSMILVSFLIFSLNLSILLRVILSLSILTIYLLFMIRTKILTKEDFNYLKNISHPKKMISYIKDEISY